MKFALVRLVRNKGGRGGYHSYIEKSETVHSTLAGHKKFASRQAMIATMAGILAAQKRKVSFFEVLKRIETSGSFDFVGDDSLDLTDEQAESLGWPKISKTK
jgi:hypothetical protein